MYENGPKFSNFSLGKNVPGTYIAGGPCEARAVHSKLQSTPVSAPCTLRLMSLRYNCVYKCRYRAVILYLAARVVLIPWLRYEEIFYNLGTSHTVHSVVYALLSFESVTL